MNDNKKVLILFLIVVSISLLASCIMPFGISSDKSVVTIQTGLLPANARGTVPPGGTEIVRILITAPDMEPIERTITSGTIELEVPAGEMRFFSIQTYNQIDLTYYGARHVNLPGGQSTLVNIEMNPIEYGGYGDIYCLVHSPIPLTYPQAATAAAQAAVPGSKSYLAIIDDANHQASFTGYITLTDGTRYWIGFQFLSNILTPIALGTSWGGYFNQELTNPLNPANFGVSMLAESQGQTINQWESLPPEATLNDYIVEFESTSRF